VAGQPVFVTAADGATEPVATPRAPLAPLATSRQKGIALGNAPVTATVPLNREVNSALLHVFEGARNEKVLLSLEDITFRRSPGVVFEIYLNVPMNQVGLASSTNYFVGNLSFFGLRPEGEKILNYSM